MEEQRIGSAIIVLDKEKKKILLGKRKNGYKSGMFGLPGGRLHLNESLSDCAKRELLEETGLLAQSTRYLGVVRELQEGYNFVHFGFLCDKYQGEPQVLEPEKCKSWQWVSFNQLPKNILASHKAIIDFFLNSSLPAIKEIIDPPFNPKLASNL